MPTSIDIANAGVTTLALNVHANLTRDLVLSPRGIHSNTTSGAAEFTITKNEGLAVRASVTLWAGATDVTVQGVLEGFVDSPKVRHPFYVWAL